ncbi:hypothetical protein [Legionella saoudiensis]|uniref:hypothetical protein n=1 Tax=Legionella saoudiensis TaxID=1750561 RepID=UPI0018C2ADC7|nr:hypothetical protein [Legionella saoudiensis]
MSGKKIPSTATQSKESVVDFISLLKESMKKKSDRAAKKTKSTSRTKQTQNKKEA